LTLQIASSKAKAPQNAVNGNVPVQVAGDDAKGGSSMASQTATNSATSGASNTATTSQTADVSQSGDNAGCKCVRNGYLQKLGQLAATLQFSWAAAYAPQNAVNANKPEQVAGDDTYGGMSMASETAKSSAGGMSSNTGDTIQEGSARPE
jgi:hypothetical protein